MQKSNWQLSKKSVGKMALAGVILAVGILIYFYRLYGELRLSDACFLSGLFLCCVGLFRVVRILGLLNLPIYGFKKLGDTLHAKFSSHEEPTMGSYAAYLQEETYEQCFTAPLLVGGILIALSLLLLI